MHPEPDGWGRFSKPASLLDGAAILQSLTGSLVCQAGARSGRSSTGFRGRLPRHLVLVVGGMAYATPSTTPHRPRAIACWENNAGRARGIPKKIGYFACTTCPGSDRLEPGGKRESVSSVRTKPVGAQTTAIDGGHAPSTASTPGQPVAAYPNVPQFEQLSCRRQTEMKSRRVADSKSCSKGIAGGDLSRWSWQCLALLLPSADGRLLPTFLLRGGRIEIVHGPKLLRLFRKAGATD